MVKFSACACAINIRSNGSCCGPGSRPARMPCARSNRKTLKPRLLQVFHKISCNFRSSWEPSQTNLCRHFPRGRCAYKDCVSLVHQHAANRLRQRRAFIHPPDQCMCIQQEGHSKLLPAFSSSGGSGKNNSSPTSIFPFHTPGSRAGNDHSNPHPLAVQKASGVQKPPFPLPASMCNPRAPVVRAAS